MLEGSYFLPTKGVSKRGGEGRARQARRGLRKRDSEAGYFGIQSHSSRSVHWKSFKATYTSHHSTTITCFVNPFLLVNHLIDLVPFFLNAKYVIFVKQYSQVFSWQALKMKFKSDSFMEPFNTYLAP